MIHIRHQLREAARAALDGITPAGDRVHRGRVHTVDAKRLPAIAIHTPGERIEAGAMGSLQARSVMLAIEIRAASQAIDDDLDAIGLQVEAVIATDPGLAAIATDIQLEETAIRFEPQGETRFGLLEMRWRILVHTDAANPAAPL